MVATKSGRVQRIMKRFSWLFVVAGAACLPSHALARECVNRYPAPETMALTFDMAQNLRRSLDEMQPQADVVLLARGGQDLSRFGLVYSHLAFALRDDQGQWRVVHELNRCKTGRSDLYREGLVNFIGEGVLRADVLVLVPKVDLQVRLRQLLLASANGATQRLHEPRYSLVAYPFSTEYQNSNQWVLEVLASAAMPGPPSTDRKQAQAWLRTAGYQPASLHIKLQERLAARFGIDNATTTDHPASERLTGDYSVVTVDSVADFMRAKRWLAQELVVPRVTGATGSATN